MNKLENVVMTYKLIVGFDDVDYARVVYFPRFLAFAERAQADMLRRFGYSQSRLSEEFNIGNPIVHVENRYLAPARLDDTLLVRHQIKNLTRRGFEFLFDIRNEDEDKLLCTGKITHRFINMNTFTGAQLNDELFEAFQRMAREGE